MSGMQRRAKRRRTDSDDMEGDGEDGVISAPSNASSSWLPGDLTVKLVSKTLPDIPTWFVTADFWLIVQVSLPPDARGRLVQAGSVPLEVQLVQVASSGLVPTDAQSLQVHGTPMLDPSKESMEVKVRIKMCSGKAPYRLRLSTAEARSGGRGQGLQGYSDQFFVFKQFLDYIGDDRPETEWYNAVGGKSNVLKLRAGLFELTGTKKKWVNTHPDMELKAVLLLADGTRVGAHVLKLTDEKGAPRSGHTVTMRNGEVEVFFRIEDVSHNHGDQGFKLRLEPLDSDAANALKLGWMETESIIVKSKVNLPKQRGGKATPISAMDHIEIGQLISAFLHHLDQGKASDFADLFDVEGSVHVVRSKDTATGVHQLKSFCSALHSKFQDATHWEANVLVKGDSLTATNVSYWQAIHKTTRVVTATGRHEDEFVRVLDKSKNKVWRFKSRTIYHN